VWRKRAVAMVVAVLAGAGAAGAWMPSLLAGGLAPWVVLGVPVLLLGASRLVMWPWVTESLATRPAALTLTGGVLLASAWVAVSFGYRVLEVPAAPIAVGPQSSPADEEQATDLVRNAIVEFDKVERSGGGGGPPGMVVQTRAWDVMQRLAQQGWAGAPPELGPWLDRVCEEKWMKPLREAADLSPAALADARSRLVTGDVERSRKALDVLTARALQLHAAGHDAAALDSLVSALALSRALRNRAMPPAYLLGAEGEQVALGGFDHWLAGVREPKLLRRALAELARHETDLPPAADCVKLQYQAFLHSLDDPAVQKSATGLGAETVAVLAVVPWERRRSERLVGQVFAGRLRAAEAGDVAAARSEGGADAALGDWLPAPDVSRERLAGLVSRSWLRDYLPPTEGVQRSAPWGLCRVRAARLQAALVLYRLRHGRPAPDLDALVPDYLPDLPPDPYSGEPFRYRVSEGERLAWVRNLPGGKAELVREVPAGQGVLWSVGPDGVDHGGTRQWDDKDAPVSGARRDLIFLVPK
jgi:hypothetical protein